MVDWMLFSHDSADRTDNNSYNDWIENYAGADYQAVARGAVERLDDLARRRGGDARFAALSATFNAATRLEVGFWDMGLGLRS